MLNLIFVIPLFIFSNCNKYDDGFTDIIYYENVSSLSFRPEKCRITEWKKFPQIDNFYLNSSLAIYNGFVFEVEEGGRITILDYNTKKTIGSCTMTIQKNHANNANFSNVFYHKDDQFPLLYVSRCQRKDQECLVYRISRNDSWNTELVQTIHSDTNPNNFDSSWTIDNENKIIYYYSYTNGNYNVYTNNGCIIYAWKLPDISQNVVLLKKDALFSFELPYCILQGACVYKGLILLNAHGNESVGVPDYGIWAIEPSYRRRVWRILPQLGELEGICVYDNKIYTSNRTSNTTTAVPLRIYEYEFESDL